eukprot:6876339-Alexandrium_andersonii.AAC.1
MAPFACGSYTGGDSSTVCTPSRSATARRKSTNAGSLSVFSRTLRRCPRRWMLAAAWSTVLAQAALARNGMRQDGLGIPALDDEDRQGRIAAVLGEEAIA